MRESTSGMALCISSTFYLCASTAGFIQGVSECSVDAVTQQIRHQRLRGRQVDQPRHWRETDHQSAERQQLWRAEHCIRSMLHIVQDASFNALLAMFLCPCVTWNCCRGPCRWGEILVRQSSEAGQCLPAGAQCAGLQPPAGPSTSAPRWAARKTFPGKPRHQNHKVGHCRPNSNSRPCMFVIMFVEQ